MALSDDDRKLIADVYHLEAERDTLRAEVERLKQERDCLVETQKNLIHAANSDIDRIVKERDAALAKCAEMSGVLIETKKLIQYPQNLQAARHLPYLNRLDAAISDNPGQPLLDRLALAEKVVEAADKAFWASFMRHHDTSHENSPGCLLCQFRQAVAAYREAAAKERK